LAAIGKPLTSIWGGGAAAGGGSAAAAAGGGSGGNGAAVAVVGRLARATLIENLQMMKTHGPCPMAVVFV